MAQKEEKTKKKKTEPKNIHDERTGETFELVPLEQYFDEEVQKGADISHGLAVVKEAMGHLDMLPAGFFESPDAPAKLTSETDKLVKKYSGADAAASSKSKQTQQKKKKDKKGQSASTDKS